MEIYTKQEIEKAIDIPFLLQEIEAGLVQFFLKKSIVSPVGFLHFNSPPGDVHIKSTGVFGGDFYVVKIASGFYDNPKRGLSSSNGLMLLFKQKTGEVEAILLDEGRLTDLRTGIAGAIAAKYLANPKIEGIGIIGTGIQAKEQLFALSYVTECRRVHVWGRNQINAEIFASRPEFSSFQITVADSIEELAAHSNLIVTTTPSTAPLLYKKHLRPGTHVTAVGADSKGKQELGADVFEAADLVVADSLEQCLKFGDLAHAKKMKNPKIQELGELITHPITRSPDAITVADLTGIAIEDLQIAKAVYSSLKRKTTSLFAEQS